MTPLAMGGVAFSTATATTVTTDGGVVEDKPATGSPEHCTSDEGRQVICIIITTFPKGHWSVLMLFFLSVNNL